MKVRVIVPVAWIFCTPLLCAVFLCTSAQADEPAPLPDSLLPRDIDTGVCDTGVYDIGVYDIGKRLAEVDGTELKPRYSKRRDSKTTEARAPATDAVSRPGQTRQATPPPLAIPTTDTVDNTVENTVDNTVTNHPEMSVVPEFRGFRVIETTAETINETINDLHDDPGYGCAPSCGSLAFDPGWNAMKRHVSTFGPTVGRQASRHVETLFGRWGAARNPYECKQCGLLDCTRKTHGRFYIDGWTSQGTTLNFDNPDGKRNTPLRYNDVANEFVLNQLYLRFGRQIDKHAGRWDWGARVDLLYGSDYLYTSAIGLETRTYSSLYGTDRTPQYDPSSANLRWNANDGPRRYGVPATMYGLSMPQLYAELFIPYGYGTTVRAGHFYADMGYESVMSPNNFFYSHGYGFMFGMPTTFTGITLEQQWTRNLALIAGITQGGDIWESPNKSVGWLGGLRWKAPGARSRFSFMLGADRPSDRDDYRTHYSLVFARSLTPRLEYALEHTFGYEENASGNNASGNNASGNNGSGDSCWYSIAQCLQWALTDKLALGLRGEWFRDDGHKRVLRREIDPYFGKITGRDYYEITLGLNWRPTRFLTVRPEVRYDWSDVGIESDYSFVRQEGVYDNGKKREQLTFGIDMTVRF